MSVLLAPTPLSLAFRSLSQRGRNALVKTRFGSPIGTPMGATPRPDSSRRWVHLEAIMMPPLVFTGLLGALWLWKCTMMIIFQNRIIYMPGLPPGARKERIQDYSRECVGVAWEQVDIRAAEDRTSLAVAVSSVESGGGEDASSPSTPPAVHMYILYLQGNASSTPPRLPNLSGVLRTLKSSPSPGPGPRPVRYTMACLSYRGYWRSRGWPSERGINRDVRAGLVWMSESHAKAYGSGGEDQSGEQGGKTRPIFVVWGQSIGAGFATNLAASLASANKQSEGGQIDSLILETPFLSIRAMLEALYPQKWLPYRHLWPFLRNQLDSWANLGVIAASAERAAAHSDGRTATWPRILLVVADKDEIVPREHADQLARRCHSLGIQVEECIVQGAYHNEASSRGQGQRAIASFILRAVES